MQQQLVGLAARCSLAGSSSDSSSSRRALGCRQVQTRQALMRRSTATRSSRSQSSRCSRPLGASSSTLLVLVLLLEGPWVGLGPRQQQEASLLLLLLPVVSRTHQR